MVTCLFFMVGSLILSSYYSSRTLSYKNIRDLHNKKYGIRESKYHRPYLKYELILLYRVLHKEVTICIVFINNRNS